MKIETKTRKNAIKGFRQLTTEQQTTQKIHEVILEGKKAMDGVMLELGRVMVESILYLEREEIAGPDYHPLDPEVKKWASQGGSVYLGDQKVRVERPRVRGPQGEIGLKSYEQMSQRGGFSEELLARALRGVSARKYHETVIGTAAAFGVSRSAVSQHIVEATTAKLKEFKEGDFSDFKPFSIFLDTVHRGGEAFVVALGLDQSGLKRALGFWEGASENKVVAEELLADLEHRGLALGPGILYVVDGGKGLIKALEQRYGKGLVLQRCTIHKDRNIQKHLPKRYRKEAHRRFRIALEQNEYKEAKKMLKELEQWLRTLNESAADFLLEAMEEILTLHRLKVPALLRKTLHSTNPIESVFSQVRHCEKNIKRYRNSRMAQRWLASVLLHAETTFRRIKGYEQIGKVIEEIKKQINHK